MIITSRANPTIKFVNKLRHRKEREASGLFIMEGLRIIGAALEQGVELEKLIISPGDLKSDYGKSIIEQAQNQEIDILEVSSDVLSHLSLKDHPQGMIAVGRQIKHCLEDLTLEPGRLWIGLHEIADPGNLGTILRTSDATGCEGVILIGHCTDPYDPEAIRGSMGAIFSQQIFQCDTNDFISWMQKHHPPLIGTSDRATTDYQELAYPDPMVLLMGSEREGLPGPLMTLCQARVRIPMVGRSDSLNLAVATAVILYQIFNQRRKR